VPRLADVSARTVYTVMRAPAEAGLALRGEQAGSQGMDELRSDDHRDAACRSVRALAAVSCTLGHAPHLTAAESLVDDIDPAEISDPGRRPIGGAASTATGAIGAESGRRAAREERHRRV
jgi:Fur family transcriptional regulator, stress-responsive regulator